MANKASFEEIYNQHSSLVYNFALNYVQNTHDAQDITQEVFVKVFRKMHQYNPETASMKTWICRITINHCMDFIRSRKSRKRFGAIPAIEHEGHPGIAAEDREEISYLFGLINALPPNQKTAIILVRIEGRSQKETAEIMNISVKALESLLQRAKQILSKKMRR